MVANEKIRVLIAEDHEPTRANLRALVLSEGMEISAETGSGKDAIRLAGELRPDVAILDVFMPDTNGIIASHLIKEISPSTKTVLVSLYLSVVNESLAARMLGANAYVSKTRAVADLIPTIRALTRPSQSASTSD